eukprot:GHVT01008195.1.p1 GENE.GHVT01008195.1~~GHVT01008195.1.p1  ORF type:complete len:113 (-),score=3.03 GHVT01008195.1:740-1078(-)
MPGQVEQASRSNIFRLIAAVDLEVVMSLLALIDAVAYPACPSSCPGTPCDSHLGARAGIPLQGAIDLRQSASVNMLREDAKFDRRQGVQLQISLLAQVRDILLHEMHELSNQ